MKKEFTDIDISNWIRWTTGFHKKNGMRFDFVSSKMSELVPFVGSGFSAFIYGSWSEVMLKLADGLSNDVVKQDVINLINTPNFYDAGDILRKPDNISDAELSFMMNEIFAVHKIKDFKNNPDKRQQFIQEAVCYIPFLSKKKKRCYTTNFDKVLEETFLDQRLHCVSANPNEHHKISQAEGNGDIILLKLHGSIGSPGVNFVLSNKDASKHYADGSDLIKCLEDSILHYTLFFLGAGLDKDFTVERLKKLKDKHSERPHFAIISAKYGEDLEKRTEELDSMHIIPLFYPNYDELGHKWVPIILKWLTEGHNPYRDETLKAKIEQFEKSGKYKYTTYNMRSDFQNLNGDFGKLRSFLDCSHRFLWWQICGASDFGKTRWMHELMIIAQKQDWNSYIYDGNNYDNFKVESFGSNKHTLIIFDDADLYNMETNKDSLDINAKIAFNGFCSTMQRLINMSNPDTMKLRVIFTFTKDNKQREGDNSNVY